MSHLHLHHYLRHQAIINWSGLKPGLRSCKKSWWQIFSGSRNSQDFYAPSWLAVFRISKSLRYLHSHTYLVWWAGSHQNMRKGMWWSLHLSILSLEPSQAMSGSYSGSLWRDMAPSLKGSSRSLFWSPSINWDFAPRNQCWRRWHYCIFSACWFGCGLLAQYL